MYLEKNLEDKGDIYHNRRWEYKESWKEIGANLEQGKKCWANMLKLFRSRAGEMPMLTSRMTSNRLYNTISSLQLVYRKQKEYCDWSPEI